MTTVWLGTVGTLSLLALFYILAKLSERFGSVIKMQPLYRYYYLALIFLAIASLAHLAVAKSVSAPGSIPDWFNSTLFLLLAYHLPLTIGVTIGMVITWRYWSWLVTEQSG